MIKRGFFLGLIFLLVSTSLLSAASTNISLETLPSHDISISVLKTGGEYDLIKNFQGVSNADGKFSVIFSSDNFSSIDLKVYAKKNGQLVIMKKFGPFSILNPISLELYPEGYVKPIPVVQITNTTNTTANTTAENQTQTLNETVDLKITQEGDAKPSLTGLATSDDSTSSGKTIYYILGGIILLALIVIGRFLISKKSPHKEVRVRKLSEIQRELKEAKSTTDFKKIVVKEEKEIVKLEKEVSKMKSQERIKEIENRVRRDQEEVRRLRER